VKDITTSVNRDSGTDHALMVKKQLEQ
jgi:hypothetical protein